ncbi:1-deoxy-D-xylulose-5-phosphate reductoisomerase [Sphingopyxis sp. XHP0097]|uniref:1-deoxy-D-xylulose 5-phosphate reductoisomerase n=1 Tax=Sphingopyxis jiangsuensis TaxID=2871171 RepID=A0ABS7MAR9_9SPHN|nr:MULTISPECIES: 1-deoxy-D-xylulose-5-phosphate reductoisomerase [Sphingopyxis]MBY4636113.1 1-deoxy-D-xylulose-5-phosphate reductoisomerase [Sphingopyxis jiangsuensis]
MTRRLALFGATGSVGQSTLDLVRRDSEAWRISVLTANCDVAELARLAREFRPELAVVADESCHGALRDALAGTGVEVAAGADALVAAAQRPADLVMAAIVGTAGLAPTMAALASGHDVALANKEALVSAGELMTAAARASGATILPVDSEHNAIFQCLAGGRLSEVRRIILTASGGPFRTMSAADMATVTPAQAVAHPNWSMGAKISVDSATMMNKGLELIEAHHLFPVGLDRIDILVHPQSVIHSLVEFVDCSTLAQLGSPDMRIPIASALAWPQRMATPCAPLDLASIARLDFEAPDEDRFPATALCRAAITEGGARPAQLNAANEVAVAAFLAGRISFPAIVDTVRSVMEAEAPPPPASLQDIFSVDAASRAAAQTFVDSFEHA